MEFIICIFESLLCHTFFDVTGPKRNKNMSEKSSESNGDVLYLKTSPDRGGKLIHLSVFGVN